MRIGIVLAKPPGYTETFFRSKIIGLQNKGFEVSLYCQENTNQFKLCPVYTRPPLSGNPALQSISILYTYFSTISSFKNVRRFVRLERQQGTGWSKIFKKIYLNAHILKAEADWLHFGFATMALERELLAEAIGAKMAVSFRGFDIDVYPLKDPGCYKMLWHKVDKVHAISEYLLKKARKQGLPEDKPFQIIHPAVDLKKFPVSSKPIDNSGKLSIITVARLHWIKGLDILITTAGILRDRNIDFEWVIAGGGDKKEEERYRYHIYEKNLEQQVKLLGPISHTETLGKMNNADIYIQTSLSEGFCNAVLEAQALGKLCIAFNVGGLPENIKNGKTGFLADDLSAEQLAKKIMEVLNLSKSEKSIYSEFAVQRVKETFPIEKQQQAFQTFYYSI